MIADADLGRWIGFQLYSAEEALGITERGLSLDHRIEAVLAGAMDKPAAIDPQTYATLYALRADNTCNPERA